jgi:glycosyltransferase involved in cell wall biosynthesis
MLSQLAFSLLNSQPLAVSRYASEKLRSAVAALTSERHFDLVICDFLAAAPNVPDISSAVLFQHNVETTIWKRQYQSETHTLKRAFFKMQADKMERYERSVCRRARHVIAVSPVDADRMKQMFDIQHVEAVPTGVDVEYFRPTGPIEPAADLLFSGSMDWLPNVDAIEYFLAEVFPHIRSRRPETTFVIAGRSPDPRVLKAAERVPGVTVTGSVPDMRPYLWNSKLSIVPIRIGGGTRLKVYESMAAGLPVVSTTIGAEGLDYADGKDIVIADTPEAFASSCLRLLEDSHARNAVSANALSLVEENFSWASVTCQFEAILEKQRTQ